MEVYYLHSSLTTFIHCCSTLTYSILPAPPPFDLASPVLSLHLFLFTPHQLSSSFRPLLLLLCLEKCNRACCLPKPASFLSRPHPFTALQPIYPQSLSFFFFTTSSFLSLSPLIYLSRWAPTRSDALPLCLCCMCVIWIPYLPQWNSLVCLRPQWLHPNLSLCWLSQGPGHQGLHFRKRALRGSVASWCGCYYRAPTLLAFIFPPHSISSFKNASPVFTVFP